MLLLLKAQIRSAKHTDKAVVLLDEEYGYLYHVWFTDMTPKELESYWASISDMSKHYMNPTRSLPGKFHTMISEADEDFWFELKVENRDIFYTAHISCDGDDSYLAAPDGQVITTKGDGIAVEIRK